MKLFRSLVSLVALAGFVGGAAFAQKPAIFGGDANAYAFAYGINPLVPALQVDLAGGPTSAGVATLTISFGTVALNDGTIITPLSTSAAVTVGTGANAETVTPSAVSCTTPQVYQSCSFTATFSNAHGTGDRVSSASYGITEAGVYLVGKLGGGTVSIDGTLLKAAGITYTHAAINTFITGVKSGGATAIALDKSGVSVTATPALSYQSAVGVVYASTTHGIY